MAIRVIFLGNSSSAFSRRHLSALVKQSDHLVALVDVPLSERGTTNPAADELPDFAATARKFHLPLFSPSSPNTQQFATDLRRLAPDLFIAAGYPLILKSPALEIPRLLAANFHASLLPHYRGKHPVFWTLRGGERWAGLTVHAMDAGIDTGDILYQVRVRTRRADTVASLYTRIMDKSVTLIEQLLSDARNGSIPRQTQPQDAGSYYSSIENEDYHLDWDWPAEKIRRHIAITPGKCFFKIQNRAVYFHNAETETLANPVLPGTLLQIRRKWAAVATAQGTLTSRQVQVMDEPVETFAGFCRRMDLNPGDRLT